MRFGVFAAIATIVTLSGCAANLDVRRDTGELQKNPKEVAVAVDVEEGDSNYPLSRSEKEEIAREVWKTFADVLSSDGISVRPMGTPRGDDPEVRVWVGWDTAPGKFILTWFAVPFPVWAFKVSVEIFQGKDIVFSTYSVKGKSSCIPCSNGGKIRPTARSVALSVSEKFRSESY